MNNLKSKEVKRVFDSIEEINETFGVDLELPETVPEGCNLLCYEVKDIYNVELFHYYKLEDELKYYAHGTRCWSWSNHSLEDEIQEDVSIHGGTYIYLHLAKKDDKDKFIPERLLGVQTDRGFIRVTSKAIVNCEGTGLWFAKDLSYYISDDSDETVSFDEYVKLFYDVEGDL